MTGEIEKNLRQLKEMDSNGNGLNFYRFVINSLPIEQMLESLGYDVTTRTSSIEALELFKARPDRCRNPHLALCPEYGVTVALQIVTDHMRNAMQRVEPDVNKSCFWTCRRQHPFRYAPLDQEVQ